MSGVKLENYIQMSTALLELASTDTHPVANEHPHLLPNQHIEHPRRVLWFAVGAKIPLVNVLLGGPP